MRVPRVDPIDAEQARLLLSRVAAADVQQELNDEYLEREARAARREGRGRAGRPAQCGGCYWTLRNAAQPCPRCGYTNGYGYPR